MINNNNRSEYTGMTKRKLEKAIALQTRNNDKEKSE